MNRFILIVLWVAPFLMLAQSCAIFGTENCRGLDPTLVTSGTYRSSGAREAEPLRDADGDLRVRIDRENSVTAISYTDPEGRAVIERWTMLNPRIE